MPASASVSSVLATITTASSVSAPTSTPKVTGEGGVLSGGDPFHYDPLNPVVLFIIQAGIIIIICNVLHYFLKNLRQPRVVAEILGGIVLGPSVMMRIPGFQQVIFPPASMAGLSLVANVGLILFLFLVGLEVNMGMFLSNWRPALSVGFAGMVLPFALGCGLSWGLYTQFDAESAHAPLGIYMLFIGTALSITAFPVLCRILTDLKMLNTSVGVTVLAAGVGNDIVGWILLALCVAFVNNGSGIAALYVLLCCVGWVLFLVYAIRPIFIWFLRRAGSFENGPSQLIMTVTLLSVFASSWFTGIIGVHPIFGAFLIGIICPHEGGFAIKVTEKIEDVVTVVFLPLYFALSGLSTDLGLLNNTITWAYVICVILVAFGGKVIGGTLAAKAHKMNWRESMTVGALMSCKGLVELIILNIGLQAKILSTRTFTIFVVMTFAATLATTPLASSLYPPEYMREVEAMERTEVDCLQEKTIESDGVSLSKPQNDHAKRILVYLRLDSLPSLFTLISLLGDSTSVGTRVHQAESESASSQDTVASSASLVSKRPLQIHGSRMLELTERTSELMQVEEVQENYRDPVVNVFGAFAQLHDIAVSGSVSVIPRSSFAENLAAEASKNSSDLILIPWSDTAALAVTDSPLEQFSSSYQASFIQKTFAIAPCNTAIFVNQGFGGAHARDAPRPTSLSTHVGLQRGLLSPITNRSHHILVPFFGGNDDRVALRFALQLAQNNNITVSVIHFMIQHRPDENAPSPINEGRPGTGGSASNLTISETEHSSHPNGSAAQNTAFLHTLRDSLPPLLGHRVAFTEVITTNLIADCRVRAHQELGHDPNAGNLVICGRRHILTAASSDDSHTATHSDLRATLGVVAESLISDHVHGSIIVVQAAGVGLNV